MSEDIGVGDVVEYVGPLGPGQETLWDGLGYHWSRGERAVVDRIIAVLWRKRWKPLALATLITLSLGGAVSARNVDKGHAGGGGPIASIDGFVLHHPVSPKNVSIGNLAVDAEDSAGGRTGECGQVGGGESATQTAISRCRPIRPDDVVDLAYEPRGSAKGGLAADGTEDDFAPMLKFVSWSHSSVLDRDAAPGTTTLAAGMAPIGQANIFRQDVGAKLTPSGASLVPGNPQKTKRDESEKHGGRRFDRLRIFEESGDTFTERDKRVLGAVSLGFLLGLGALAVISWRAFR